MITNTGTIMLPPGALNRSYTTKLKVLYQSLEFNKGNNFSEKLSKDFTSKTYTFTSCQDNRGEPNYDNKVKKLLETYLFYLKITPDIIILGEYTPNQQNDNNISCKKGSKYIFAGSVDISKGHENAARGTRGMSIWYKDNSISLHRISIHNTGNISTHKDIKIGNYDLAKDTQRNHPEYEKFRNMRIEAFSKQVGHIGQFIELMYKNRYIVFAHITGCGAGAQKNAGLLIAEHDYIHLAGDLNVNVRVVDSKPQHKIEKDLRIFGKDKTRTKMFGANTDVTQLLSDPHCPYALAQLEYNIPGKTAKGDVVHDGLYITEQDRTQITSLGSIWPFIPNNYRKDNYILMSDHKGFLLEIAADSTQEDCNTTTNAQTNRYASSLLQNSSKRLREK